MVSSNRARIALAALLGIFMIPLFTSSLNGLTHVLTCQAEQASPFTVEASDDAPPVALSAASLERGQDPSLCGGLTLDLGVSLSKPGELAIIVPITNHTRYPWKGSVKLVLDGVSVPPGSISPMASGTETGRVVIPVRPGRHEIAGTLLIGP
jgi:hypothetical protein